MGKEFDFEKLKGAENFHTWKFAMRNYLVYKGLEGCICDPVTETNTGKLSQCKSVIALSVESSIYVHIQKCNSAIDIWCTLEKLYEEKGMTRKIGLLRNLIGTKLDECDGMQTYIDKILKCSHQLSSIGFEITDDWSTAILLAGLTDKFNPFIMGIEAAGTQLTTDNVISKLLYFRDDKSGEAFAARKDKAYKCYNCGGIGHVKKYCKKPVKTENDRETRGNAYEGKANNAFSALLASEVKDVNRWFIDSGASNHMTPHSNILSNMRRSDVGNIIAADKTNMQCHEKGDTTLNINDLSIVVKNVLHVPELGFNLLSIYKMVQSGNVITFDRNGCEIRNQENDMIAFIKPENGVYKLCDENSRKCLISKKVDSAILWHRRLGHIGFQNMNECATG